MKIKFKKEYPDDTPWPIIVKDFLDYMSTEFQYTIDEFDVYALPETLKQYRIGELLDSRTNSITYLNAFSSAVKDATHAKMFADERRKRYQEIWEATRPTPEKTDEQ